MGNATVTTKNKINKGYNCRVLICIVQLQCHVGPGEGGGEFDELELTELMAEVEGEEGHGHPAVTMTTQEVAVGSAANDADATKWFEDISEEDLKKLDEF